MKMTSSLVVGIDSSWNAVTKQLLKLSPVENGDGIQGEGYTLAYKMSLAFEKYEGK